MKLAIFDMDHTLISTDSDLTWKAFVVREGLAPESALAKADRYMSDYDNGTLNTDEFVRFQAEEFKGRSVEEMRELCRRHFEDFVKPLIYPEALAFVRNLKDRGVPVAMLTATNLAIAGPLAEYFGFEDLLGTRLEVRSGRYTGEKTGVYGGGPGKVVIAEEYAGERGCDLSQTAYYGDSINDRFILAAVGYPVAVNPSPSLEVLAHEKGWKIQYFAERQS